ncbi:tRNA-binding protein [Xenorhabdus sp. SGI246]|uniref:tRNA-binding protein n=1 Tax=Xenorhabdus sp. SGI246 TaxID=3158263 RepID=UPI00349F3F9D
MQNSENHLTDISTFMALNIRVGRITKVEKNEKAIKPAYKLYINFGDEIGEKQSSAQLCQNYTEEQLIGKQILAVVNFPPRRVAGFKSEVLVLAAVCDNEGTVLIQPEKNVTLGTRML